MNQDKDTEVDVQENGVPVAQPSDKSEHTDIDGVILIDVTKKYRHPRHLDEEISGDALYRTYNRGLQYDSMQSREQSTDAENKVLKERMAELEKRVAESERRETLAEDLRELDYADTGVQAGAVDTQEGAEDYWGTTPESQTNERTSMIKQHGMAKLMQEIALDTISRVIGNPELLKQESLENYVQSEIAQGMQQHRVKDEAQQGRDKAIAKANEYEIANLRAKYPDATDQELTEIVARESLAFGSKINAVDQDNAGNIQGFSESYLDGMEQAHAAREKELELMLRQRGLDSDRERDAEIETLSRGGLPGEIDEPRTTRYRRKEVEAERAAGKVRGKKITDKIRALTNSGM